MIKIVALGVLVLVVAFVAYVSTRESKFLYERSGVINAPIEKIFPYISNFKMGALWSPYEQVDPNMKKVFTGPDGQVGSMMEFDGNRDAGSGKLEMLKITPNEFVEIKLTMIKPIAAENIVHYKLTREGIGTRFSWSMSGDSGFLGKLVNVFIDCEKMIGDQMNKGIANLKTLVENQK